MRVNQKRENEKLTMEIEGRIDTKTAPELEALVQEALTGVSTLVIDLKETVYISSAGLRVLLQMQKKMNQQGTMTLINVNEDVQEIFEITGFSEILTVE